MASLPLSGYAASKQASFYREPVIVGVQTQNLESDSNLLAGHAGITVRLVAHAFGLRGLTGTFALRSSRFPEGRTEGNEGVTPYPQWGIPFKRPTHHGRLPSQVDNVLAFAMS